MSSTIQRGLAQAPPETAPQAVFREIVCGVDGSRGSQLAVHQAVDLSGADGTVRFVAVHYTEGRGLNEWSTLGRDRAAEALDEAESFAEGRGVRTTCRLVSSRHAADSLRAEAAGHDLLAIGASGGSRVGGIMLGGVVTQIAHHCEQSLLIARRVVDHRLFPETVLFATDGSDASWPAALAVAHLAAVRDADVHVIHVPDDGGEELGIQVHQQFVMLTGAGGRPPAFHGEPGAVPERICQAARSSRASLVVMGRRGLGGIKALGSVSERVAHRAPSSVLLVSSGAAGR